MTIELAIKIVRPGAQVPRYQTDGASGMDLHAWLQDQGMVYRLVPGQRKSFSTGIAIQVPNGYEAQIRPRSGLATKHGIIAVLGTIDADYIGEIGVTLINASQTAFYIEHGDRIAQLVIAPVVRVLPRIVEELAPTARGDAGYGSTGIK